MFRVGAQRWLSNCLRGFPFQDESVGGCARETLRDSNTRPPSEWGLRGGSYLYLCTEYVHTCRIAPRERQKWGRDAVGIVPDRAACNHARKKPALGPCLIWQVVELVDWKMPAIFAIQGRFLRSGRPSLAAALPVTHCLGCLGGTSYQVRALSGVSHDPSMPSMPSTCPSPTMT